MESNAIKLLYDILNKYDPSLSTIQASMLLDEVVADIETLLGTTYKQAQEENN